MEFNTVIAKLTYLITAFSVSTVAKPKLHTFIYEGASRVTIAALLSSGIDPNEENEELTTPLHAAVSTNHLHACHLLLEAGANPAATDNFGATPLHYAASGNRLQILKLLLETEVEVNARDNTGKTAIMIAAKYGHYDCFRALLFDPRVKVNTVDEMNLTALQFAADEGCLDILTLLMNSKANGNARNNTHGMKALHRAVIKGQTDVALKLMTMPMNINDADETGATCVHYAARYGRKKLLLALLGSGGNAELKDGKENTGLINAVIVPMRSTIGAHLKACHLSAEIVKAFILLKADIYVLNNNGLTAEQCAQMYQNRETQLILKRERLSRSAGEAESILPPILYELTRDHPNVRRIRELLRLENVDAKDHIDRTALQVAVQKSISRLVRAFLEAGADVTMKDALGNTSLHLARTGKIARMLLSKNKRAADIRNFIGNLPLHCAVQHQLSEVVVELAPITDNIHARNDKGLSSLDLAALTENVPVAECLLRCGAAMEPGMSSSLHWAARMNSVEMTKLLMRRLDPLERDEYGHTPAHMAAMHSENPDVLRAVLQATPPDVVNYFGHTLLHSSVICRNHSRNEKTMILIDHGVSIDAKTYKGESAVHLATQKGYAETLRNLIYAGADISAITIKGKCALHIAVRYGHLECASILVRTNRELLTLRDYKGDTPGDKLMRLGYEFPHACALMRAMSLTPVEISATYYSKVLSLQSRAFAKYLLHLKEPVPFRRYWEYAFTVFKAENNVTWENGNLFESYLAQGVGIFYAMASFHYPRKMVTLNKPPTYDELTLQYRSFKKEVTDFESEGDKKFFVDELKYTMVEIFLKKMRGRFRGTYLEFLPEELIETVFVDVVNRGNVLGCIDLLANVLMLALKERAEMEPHKEYLSGEMAMLSEQIVPPSPRNR